ncbi:hypothetical protein Bca52824_038208 [Brassica carinata]|uniref:Uncharacterized protein n=1 Tax=Brassica carinata TaxID=52824 RepID=A0A8X7UUQ9_BRACI|nr:hypothetical protein Bca52824_038208 [Brassica carinata]
MGEKEKNQYSLWNSEEIKVLIELLVEGIQRGWRDSNENVVKRRVEKLVSRKRSRTDASSSSVEINTDQSDAMVMMTSKILTFIQQREERQQKEVEKREAEKKKNSV